MLYMDPPLEVPKDQAMQFVCEEAKTNQETLRKQS